MSMAILIREQEPDTVNDLVREIRTTSVKVIRV